MKFQDRGVRGVRDVECPIEYLLKFCGQKSLEEYKKSDANILRDALYEKGLSSSSIKRIFESLRAVFNLAYSEYELNHSSPFSGIILRKESRKERSTFETATLKAIQEECRQMDDANRWLIALLSDSGLRLGEAVGLVEDDIILDSEHPHLKLVEHPWRV